MIFNLDDFIQKALNEDISEGDHSTLACIPKNATGKAQLIAKQAGVVAGIRIVQRVFELFDPSLVCKVLIHDGSEINPHDVVLILNGSSQSILQSERLVLNFMQRMSGIASTTKSYVQAVAGTKAKILDTRKTTPNMRFLEKEAVRLGGGMNHRMGLYDMIMLKDNHIDFAGGVIPAIKKTLEYLDSSKLNLAIEIEVRNFDELNEVINTKGVQRILLDNFTIEETRKAVDLIKSRFEIESSGGINP